MTGTRWDGRASRTKTTTGSGRRVVLRTTGEAGTVIKTLNQCVWVRMDDGREMSGAAIYWKKSAKAKP